MPKTSTEGNRGTLSGCVHAARVNLHEAGYSANASQRDAELLARTALKWDTVDWLVRQHEPATREFCDTFDAAIARRCRHEPLAYITGTREFYGRAFRVTPDVLIPRPETELIVDEALAVMRTGFGSDAEDGSRRSDAPAVADVGTGSGCLAVTLALECPTWTVLATDLSTAALAVAADNAARLNAADRVHFRHVAFLGNESERFDLIVANPPYVGERERPALMPDVRDYEPPLALFGGPDGLDVIRELLPAIERALVPGGWFVVEIGNGQMTDVTSICEASGLIVVRVSADLAGIPRVMVGRKRS